MVKRTTTFLVVVSTSSVLGCTLMVVLVGSVNALGRVTIFSAVEDFSDVTTLGLSLLI